LIQFSSLRGGDQDRTGQQGEDNQEMMITLDVIIWLDDTIRPVAVE
jgi:hypothetical protein